MEPKFGLIAISTMIIIGSVIAQPQLQPQPQQPLAQILPQPQPLAQPQPQPLAQPQPQPNLLTQLAQNENVKAAYNGIMKATNSSSATDLLKKGLAAIMENVYVSMNKTDGLKSLTKDKMLGQAIDICGEVLEDSIESVKRSMDSMDRFDPARIDEYVEDLKVWIGGVFSDQMVCMDGFVDMPGMFGRKMEMFLSSAKKLTYHAFDLIGQLVTMVGPGVVAGGNNKAVTGRRLLSESGAMKAGMRRLAAVSVANTEPNVIVAKDGTGKYKTINEAVREIPKKNKEAFVIYVKEGVYEENVEFTKKMTNVVLYGDGPTKTRISGSLNYGDGIQTFKTATVAVKGENFLCRDMGFENTAGIEGRQAVALRVQADRAIFLNCHMDGYQDTLYAQKFRQFYRECRITGTVDFIFGDASAVFQNCDMIIKKPAFKQKCMVTAQGRTAEPETTGYVLQNCKIAPEPALAAVGRQYKIYLGRPWRKFARTVYIQCEIDGIIDPVGWAEWAGTTNMDTCYYAEFGNRGAGANLEQRVEWKGYHRITEDEAHQFVPDKFYLGDTWIPQTGVPYFPSWMAV